MRLALLLVVLWPMLGRAQQDPDPWFAPDKALHFSFSAGLAGLGYGGAALVTEDRAIRLVVGGSLALGAGIAKELLDLAGLGHPSWKDLVWDVAGTAVGLVVSWLLDRFVLTPLAQPRPELHRSALRKDVGEVLHASLVDPCCPVGGRAPRVVALAW
jgi:putative lipoprotein